MTRLGTGVLAAALLSLSSCGDDAVRPLSEDPLCAQACPSRGVAAGNAAISGVPSADAYFAALVDFQDRADGSAAAVEASIARLRAAFGVGASDSLGSAVSDPDVNLLAQAPKLVAAAPRCFVDVALVLELLSQCDPEFVPEGDTLGCKGRCQVDVGQSCDLYGNLHCEASATAADCNDTESRCNGTCDSAWSGRPCDGTCIGTCSGACDGYATEKGAGAACQGTCSGTCEGRCLRAVADARCSGECTGTCTTVSSSPTAACEDGTIEAQCEAKATRASGFACARGCAGEFASLQGVKADCKAAAFARARLLGDCRPPSVALSYAFSKQPSSDEEVRYASGLRRLEVELPGLLVALGRADLVARAGQDLASAAKDDVRDSFERELDAPTLTLQDRVGLGCALAELGRVGAALDPARKRLAEAKSGADSLLRALGGL